MAKQTQHKKQPKSLSQPSNCKGYTNKPAPGYASRERQLKITELFAPRDKDKVPFNDTIEEELELYKVLFPKKFQQFLKVKPQYPKLFSQNICPNMYKDLT